MTKGILLFCFDTADTKYHKNLERCVCLINKNIGLEITVVTNMETFKKIKPLGFINYKLIDHEKGNTKLGKEWNNVDRHMAYELSPYDITLVMDIDYFCFSDTLLQFMDTNYDFLIPDQVHDLTDRNTFNARKWSMIPMVWATVFIFKKTGRVKKLFDTIKYVKSYYRYFNDMYRITSKNFRNDYVFAIALQQLNGFQDYNVFPFALSTLPPDCDILRVEDNGIVWKCQDQINFIQNQDVHILNKEFKHV